jgi:DNA recombination protein Rad52
MSDTTPSTDERPTQEPLGTVPLDHKQVDALRQPLDPSRVRSRKGRGSGQFQYLAGHDVKRRANEIFGFGNWGYRVIRIEQSEAVNVKGDGKEGWHIGYMAVVEVTVRDCLPFSDVGYGDGVEYGPAALVTARELATKEAVTDALKRALTGWGDQFGLILYAKEDEKRRIDQDRNTPASAPAGPKSWPEIFEWAAPYGDVLGWPVWVQDASELLYKARESAKLSAEQKAGLGQKAAGAVVALRDAVDPGLMPPVSREDVQKAWASVLDGISLPGPEWRMGPDETDRPVFGEPAGNAGVTAAEQAEADSIPFGDAP